MDFAQRAHNHNYKLDPIVRSLFDTDFYKPLMQQFILLNHPNVDVTFKVTNRTKDVRLSDLVSVEEIEEQFDHARTLRPEKKELVTLRGQTYYGQDNIFKKPYIDFMSDFQLPEYEITTDETGEYVIRFAAKWAYSSAWELHSLTILNELRYRALMRTMSKSELDIMYSRAKVKLYAKLQAIADDPTLEGISVSDFGTRRRHSFLWQEYAVTTAAEVLGDRFGGTSNVHLATKHNLEARGTNAHELPMVYAALATDDEELAQAPYKLCHDWMYYVPPPLHIVLPDTFGTTGFLKHAPKFVARFAGFRPDSKKAIPAVQEFIDYYSAQGEDAKTKLAIPSDGLDVEIPGYEPHGEDIPTIYRHFKGQIRQSFGWGTLLTNDFHGCHPRDGGYMKPISIVCKVESANGRPAVKLSDNYNKATGPADEVERYRRVFGIEGLAGAPVFV